MDRRTFVQAGAASGLALGAVPALSAAPAIPRPAVPRPGPVDDVDAYLARIDAGMERIGRWSVSAEFPDFQGDRAAMDATARTALQTLFLTGMIGDLPAEQQAHPGMQERMWAAIPLMDEALERTEALLTSRSEAELERVQAVLRGPHHAAERVADLLDEQAALTGVSDYRREQLRGMVTLAGWRLANQPPELMIGEYLDKVDRLDASDIDAEARRRWLSGKVGERIFWARADLERSGLLAAGALSLPAQSLRERRIGSGAKTMGIGILVFGLGLAVASSGDGDVNGGGFWVGAITATVGAILAVIGFLVLLVGLLTPSDAGAQPPQTAAPSPPR